MRLACEEAWGAGARILRKIVTRLASHCRTARMPAAHESGTLSYANIRFLLNPRLRHSLTPTKSVSHTASTHLV